MNQTFSAQRALTFLFDTSSSFRDPFLWWRAGRGLLIVWDDVDPDQGEQTMGIGVLGQAGYPSDWDNTAFVFEKNHPGADLK